MALQVVSAAVNVYEELGVKNGKMETREETFRRGDILPDWVSSYQQFVLTQTGMARQVGDLPDPNLVPPQDMPTPTMLPEHTPSAIVGSGVSTSEVVATGPAGGAPAGSADDELPAESANKPVWEDFAVDHGYLTRNKAESMRKADLVAEVTRMHEDAQFADPEAALPPAIPAK